MAQCEAITSAYGVRHPGVKVSYTNSEGVPEFLVSDYAKLQQCIVNLVSNAQKFTKEGSVCVTMKTTARNRLQISVIDTGPGIPQALLPTKIFNQSKGLGLPTVLRFAESMNGECRAKNNVPGEGSTFLVEIPLSDDVEREMILDDHVALNVHESSAGSMVAEEKQEAFQRSAFSW